MLSVIMITSVRQWRIMPIKGLFAAIACLCTGLFLNTQNACGQAIPQALEVIKPGKIYESSNQVVTIPCGSRGPVQGLVLISACAEGRSKVEATEMARKSFEQGDVKATNLACNPNACEGGYQEGSCLQFYERGKQSAVTEIICFPSGPNGTSTKCCASGSSDGGYFICTGCAPPPPMKKNTPKAPIRFGDLASK